MTAFNRETFIAEAIESVIDSNYANWELIITDDCSTDNTLAIAKDYASKDMRITVYKNPFNLGDYPNRNKAASYAQGDYIVIVDSDDKLIAGNLEKWIAAMVLMEASFGIFSFGTDAAMKYMEPEQTIRTHFFIKPLLNYGPIATIISTDYFRSIQGFPVKYGVANDMYYNLKAASGTKTVIFPFPLVEYRRHEGQEINNSYSYLYNSYLYLRDALIELNLPLLDDEKLFLQNKNKRRFFINIIKFFWKTKDIRKIRNALKMAEFRFKDALTAVFH